MYIEQLFKYKLEKFWYLPLPILFIGLMYYNYEETKDANTNEMLHQIIDQLGENMAFVLLILPLCLFLGVVLFYNRYIQNNSVRLLTTSRSKIDWKRVFFSFILWGSITVITTLIGYYATPENFVWNFKFDKFLAFFLLAIILIPMQTSFEEYLFRGHMMQGLGLITKTRWIPLIITSVFFGLMHIANPEVDQLGPVIMIYYIGTGLFLGIITLMDEGIELALGFHAANNLFGALLVTTDWTAFQTHSILKDISPMQEMSIFQIFVPVLVLFPILIIVFAKKYQWNNWKYRLFGTIKVENYVG